VKILEKLGAAGNSSVLGAAMIAGLGVILMILVAAIGVVQGATADSNLLGLMFAGGVAFFLIGVVGWFGLTQPQKHFDDINIPKDSGHHGHDAHAAQDDHAPAEHAEAGHH
jgi:hypothetical protein